MSTLTAGAVIGFIALAGLFLARLLVTVGSRPPSAVSSERRVWRSDRLVTTATIRAAIVVTGLLAIALVYEGRNWLQLLHLTHEDAMLVVLVLLPLGGGAWAFVSWRLSIEVRATQVLEGLIQEGGAIRRELREVETPAPLPGSVRRRHVEQVGPKAYLIGFRLPPGPSLKEVLTYQSSFDLVMKCNSTWWQDGRLVWVKLGASAIPERVYWEEVDFSEVEGILPVVAGSSSFGRLVIDLTEAMHVISGGTTGGGKTTTIRSWLCQLIVRMPAEDLELELFDLKGGTGLGIFEGLPHLVGRPVVTHVAEARDRLTAMVRRMDRRLEIIHDAGAEDIRDYNTRGLGPRMAYVVGTIDELLLFDPSGAVDAAEKTVRGQCQQRLADLTTRGRAAGVHMLMFTQRPDRNVLPGQIQNNADGRLAFHTGDDYGSEVLLGPGDKAAHQLPFAPRGLAIWKTGEMVTRVRTIWITRDQALDIIRRIQRGERVDLGAPVAGLGPFSRWFAPRVERAQGGFTDGDNRGEAEGDQAVDSQPDEAEQGQDERPALGGGR